MDVGKIVESVAHLAAFSSRGRITKTETIIRFKTFLKLKINKFFIRIQSAGREINVY